MEKMDLFCEDCHATMRRMISDGQKVDLILTSPPYNSSKKKIKEDLSGYHRRYDVYEDDKDNDEYVGWMFDTMALFDSVLKENGVVLLNMSYSSENPVSIWDIIGGLRRNTPFMVADLIHWKKGSALPNNGSPRTLTRICEPFFVLCRESEYKSFVTNKKIIGSTTRGQNVYECFSNLVEARNNDGCNQLNKATFSSELVEKLLSIYAKDGSVIYDPFMGTGSTAVGVENYGHGCRFIGSEISKKQVDFSKERIMNLRRGFGFQAVKSKSVNSQLNLF